MASTDYVSAPRTVDPAELLAEKDLAILWLRDKLTELEDELADRERVISGLHVELLAAH